MSRIPAEQLAKLRALHPGGDEAPPATNTLRRSDVWLLPAEMTAFVIEAKDRPHLIVGLQGPDDAPTRALLIEGTKQPQWEPARLIVTLSPGEAGLRRETHFVFVSKRFLRRKPHLILENARYLGHVPAQRMEDVKRAVRECSLAAVKRCWEVL